MRRCWPLLLTLCWSAAFLPRPVAAAPAAPAAPSAPPPFQAGDREYTPEEIRTLPAQFFFDRMAHPVSGYQWYADLHALTQKAKDSKPAQRREIVSQAMTLIKDETSPPDQRWQCCLLLGDIGDEEVVPDLLEVLRRGGPLDGVAAEALSQLYQKTKSRRTRRTLERAARDLPSLRLAIAKRTGNVVPAPEAKPGSPEADTPTPPADFLAGDRDYTPEEIRTISAEVFLQRMAHPRPSYTWYADLRALEQKTKDSDPAEKERLLTRVARTMRDKYRTLYLRWQCCLLLGGSGEEHFVPDLIEVLLHDPSGAMRTGAVDSLLRFPQSAAAHEALLQAGRHDRDPRVRQELLRYLGDAVPDLELLPAPGTEERAPTGPAQPPPGPARPVTKPLPWPFPGGQEDQRIFNNHQQTTDDSVHGGLDFMQPAGTPVCAVDSGYVTLIASDAPESFARHFFVVTPKAGSGEGWCYTHLDPSTLTFKQGDYVHQGQCLGSLVDLSTGDQPGESHLDLRYVRLTRDASGKARLRSLLDPLCFFDWKDTQAPIFQPLRFAAEGSTQLFEADPSGLVTVSGKVDLLAAVTDSAFPGQLCDYGVPVVMFSISDGRHTLQKLTVDHRGDVGDETRVKPLYLSWEQKRTFFDADSFPRYQMLRVTKTDGDGRIAAADASQCWDTTEVDARGRPLWPNGRYSVNVYAWDIAGNRAAVSAVVRVRNRWVE